MRPGLSPGASSFAISMLFHGFSRDLSRELSPALRGRRPAAAAPVSVLRFAFAQRPAPPPLDCPRAVRSTSRALRSHAASGAHRRERAARRTHGGSISRGVQYAACIFISEMQQHQLRLSQLLSCDYCNRMVSILSQRLIDILSKCPGIRQAKQRHIAPLKIKSKRRMA